MIIDYRALDHVKIMLFNEGCAMLCTLVALTCLCFLSLEDNIVCFPLVAAYWVHLSIQTEPSWNLHLHNQNMSCFSLNVLNQQVNTKLCLYFGILNYFESKGFIRTHFVPWEVFSSYSVVISRWCVMTLHPVEFNDSNLSYYNASAFSVFSAFSTPSQEREKCE